MNTQMAERVAVAQAQFADWGRSFYPHPPGGGPSRLYAYLAEQVGQDPHLLSGILAHLEESPLPTSLPTRLFAATRFLLLKMPQPHPLRALYPDLTPDPVTRPLSLESYALFQAFCLERAEEIAQVMQRRPPALNEVGRCAPLLVALSLVAARNQGRPLAMLDVGSSAGLHLLWQDYAYLYPPDEVWRGDPTSPVRLICRLEGEKFPPLPDGLPQVMWQQGIDLCPLSVLSADDRLWLRALMWPEQRERLPVLEQALHLAQKHPPVISRGDASGEMLDGLVESVPADALLCITHSYVLIHMPEVRQRRFLERVATYARQRPVYRIAQEFGPGAATPALDLFTYRSTGWKLERLATCSGFGAWLYWKGEQNRRSEEESIVESVPLARGHSEAPDAPEDHS
jgi:hypothetical protein